MGVTAYDSEPDKWLGFQRRRDEFLQSDDRFMWRIDTFLDERSGYFFEMNPSGLMADAVFGVNGMNRAWDGIWNARVRHSEIGWTIEIEIPFRTLNFDPDQRHLGHQLPAHGPPEERRQHLDGVGAQPGPRAHDQRRPRHGHHRGHPGRRARHQALRPALPPTRSPSRDAGGWDSDPDAGVDFFYNPTPGLRANLTINTDFAQTEVDQRQVNLTRFSLFFPERRDFFLDGATYFDFASNNIGGEQVQPYLQPAHRPQRGRRTPQRIDYGTKFNGQAGGAGRRASCTCARPTIDDKGFIGEEFTAARVKRRILHAVVRRRHLHPPRRARRRRRAPATRSASTCDLSTAQFRGNQNLVASGWYLRESRPRCEQRHQRLRRRRRLPQRPLDLWRPTPARFRRTSTPRSASWPGAITGATTSSPASARGPRNSRVVRQSRFTGNLTLITNLRNELVERNVNLHAAEHAVPEPGARSPSSWIGTSIRLEAPFAISPGITLPPATATTSPGSRSRARPPTAGCWRSTGASRPAASSRARASRRSWA